MSVRGPFPRHILRDTPNDLERLPFLVPRCNARLVTETRQTRLEGGVRNAVVLPHGFARGASFNDTASTTA